MRALREQIEAVDCEWDEPVRDVSEISRAGTIREKGIGRGESPGANN